MTLGPLSIFGALLFRVTHDKGDASNYRMVYPSAIPGWHSHPHTYKTIFSFESDKRDAIIKATNAGLVAGYRPANDLDTDDLAENLMLSAKRQRGWTAVRMENRVVVDGSTFRLVRRNAPNQMMLDAVSQRGNDFFELGLLVSGPRAKQEAALESYRSDFMNLLQSLKFQRADLSR